MTPQNLEVTLSPAQLAVLIGVVELAIGEAFKNTSELAFSWLRRWKLDRTGRFRISSRWLVNSRHTFFLNSVLVAFVSVVIVLELSVGEAVIRTSTSRRAPCFGPDRWGRYITKGAPKPTELNDDRIDPYIIRAGCDNRLFTNVLQGASGLDFGYPKCAEAFGPFQNFSFKAALQGCGIGFVASSPDGDYHCDMLPVEELGRTKNELVGENFIGIYAYGKHSSSFFKTEGEQLARYISNTDIPPSLFKRKLNVSDSTTLSCPENSLDCYNRVRPALAKLRRTKYFFPVPDKSVFIKALRPGNRSSICIMSSGNLTVEWVGFNHTIPGAERDGRAGPVLTDLTLTGRAKCINNLSPITARLYFDSMENLKLGSIENPDQSTLDRQDPIAFLNIAAVVNGLKTTKSEAEECETWMAVKGSLMDTGKFLAALIFSILLIVATIAGLIFSIYAHKVCAVRVDPLDPLWPVRHLLHSGPGMTTLGKAECDSDIEDEAIRIPVFEGSGNGPPYDGGALNIIPSMTGSAYPMSQSLRTRGSVGSSPLPIMGQQPRLGQCIDEDDPPPRPPPRQNLSHGISLRSPISFRPDADIRDESPSSAGCLSPGISLRSPIVRAPDALDDDFWIGIQEDSEHGVGRFTPHASSNFETLRGYTRQIQ